MARRMFPITRQQYLEAVGTAPIQDDLERCNCHKAGTPGHTSCGWNFYLNRPVFMGGSQGLETPDEIE